MKFALGETHIFNKQAPRVGEVHFLFSYTLNKHRKHRLLRAVIPTTTTPTPPTSTTTTTPTTPTPTPTPTTTTTTTTRNHGL